jgi:hypothetical protein
MQGLPDQLDEADYVTVPRTEWRALLEEVATVRRLVAELAARLPAVQDLGDEDAGGTEIGDPREARPAERGEKPDSYDEPESAAACGSGATETATSSRRAGSAGRADPVVLRPTVVRRDELGRSIRAYEVPLQSVRPPARRGATARSEAAPIAGARAPTLDALRARVEQAAANQAADARPLSRFARWTSRLSGRQPESGAGP